MLIRLLGLGMFHKLLDFGINATQRRCRSYSSDLIFSAIESQDRLRIWLGSYSAEITFIASTSLNQADQRLPVSVP